MKPERKKKMDAAIKRISKYKRTKGRKRKRKISKPASREVRERIVILRDAGMSWGKLSEEMDMPTSTVLGIYQRETGPLVELEEEEEEEDLARLAGPVSARVVKAFPHPRLICIYFGDRKAGRFAKCVVRPGFIWRPNSVIKVESVGSAEGEDELYRLA